MRWDKCFVPIQGKQPNKYIKAVIKTSWIKRTLETVSSRAKQVTSWSHFPFSQPVGGSSPSSIQSTGIRNLQKTAVSKGKNRLVNRDKTKEGRKTYREKKKGSQNVLYKHYRNVKRSQITIILNTHEEDAAGLEPQSPASGGSNLEDMGILGGQND